MNIIMRKNFVKVLATTAMLSMLASTTAFAGQWKSDANGWWYQNDNGSYPANTWMWIDGNGDGVSESYYFDQNGHYTNWLLLLRFVCFIFMC